MADIDGYPYTSYRFKLTRGLSDRWTLKNPILAEGEPGYEIDTGRFKMGDGFTPWNGLPYFIDEDRVLAMILENASGGSGGTDPRIGDLSELTTSNQSSIVAAINEINNPPVPYTLLYQNAKA